MKCIEICLQKPFMCRVAGKPDKPTKRPFVVASGMNTVTCLIERKKAQLVAIAHDVEPIDVSSHFQNAY